MGLLVFLMYIPAYVLVLALNVFLIRRLEVENRSISIVRTIGSLLSMLSLTTVSVYLLYDVLDSNSASCISEGCGVHTVICCLAATLIIPTIVGCLTVQYPSFSTGSHIAACLYPWVVFGAIYITTSFYG